MAHMVLALFGSTYLYNQTFRFMNINKACYSPS